MKSAEPVLSERAESALNQAVIDHNELDATEISPRIAKLMSWAFVILLCAVPLSQTASELWHGNPPQALDVFRPLFDGAVKAGAGQWLEARKTWLAGLERSSLRVYEENVEANSLAKNLFQPRMQELLTAYGGFGNDKAITGRERWLYYQPGWAYVVGQNVLERSYLAKQLKKMVDKGETSLPEPDPRPALIALHESCQRAGIHLLVLPIPDKVMLQPRELTRMVDRYTDLAVPNNPGYAALESDLRDKGVDILSVWPSTVKSGEIRYLQQDTHWTPRFMESVADTVSTHISRTAALEIRSPAGHFRMVEEVKSHVGDLVNILKMTRTQKLYTREFVTIRKIVDERTGKLMQPDPESDVLLIGDSFTNIYSQPGMGWGGGAGFAEQLGYRLGRPLDVIALNGGGAWRARFELARPENAGRLGWKKLIIYEFAIHNLAGENWKVVPMVTPVHPSIVASAAPPDAGLPAAARARSETRAGAGPPPPPPPANPAPPDTGLPAAARARSETRAGAGPAPSPPAANASTASAPLIVTGRIMKTSRVPAPGTAPYKDCLTFVKFRVDQVLSGRYGDSELIAAFWAMKDNVWLPPAGYTVGDRLKLTLIPLSKAEPQIRSMQRADDLDDYTHQPLFVIKEGS